MKHLFIALTITAVSFLQTASANNPVTPPVLQAFRTAYVHAKEVNWSTTNYGYKAAFKMDGEYVVAHYTPDGTLMGTTQNLSAAELPAKLRNNLRKELKRAWVSELFVLNTDNGNVYFVTVESADAKKVFKSGNGRKWEAYQSLSK